MTRYIIKYNLIGRVFGVCIIVATSEASAIRKVVRRYADLGITSISYCNPVYNPLYEEHKAVTSIEKSMITNGIHSKISEIDVPDGYLERCALWDSQDKEFDFDE